MERKMIFTEENYQIIYDILNNFFSNSTNHISYECDEEFHLLAKFICAYSSGYHICICPRKDVYGNKLPISINESFVLNIGDEIIIIDDNMIEMYTKPTTKGSRSHTARFKKVVHTKKEAESTNDRLDRIFGLIKELDDERKECILEIIDNSYKLTSTKK